MVFVVPLGWAMDQCSWGYVKGLWSCDMGIVPVSLIGRSWMGHMWGMRGTTLRGRGSGRPALVLCPVLGSVLPSGALAGVVAEGPTGTMDERVPVLLPSWG